MSLRPHQIAVLLDRLADIADPCDAISREAASMREGQGVTDEMVQACRDLDSAIQHMFQIGNYLMKATDNGGKQ